MKAERTYRRDETPSTRHREYGDDVPMIDVDCLEIDNYKPVAVCEWKNEHAAHCHGDSPQLKILRNVAAGLQLPLFGVRYATSLEWYRITGLNALGAEIIQAPTMMDELQYVTFLYRLRGKAVPEAVRGSIKPPTARPFGTREKEFDPNDDSQLEF